MSTPPLNTPLGAAPEDLAEVERIVRGAGTSFYRGMRILPADRRAAMYAIYAFCRLVDDIADEPAPAEQKRRDLDAWRARIEALEAGRAEAEATAGAVSRTLLLAVQRFGLRRMDFLAVIDGMQTDAETVIVAPSMNALDEYCDQVASAVGRLSVRAFGDGSAAADEVAHHLGRALQLTNILRDLSEDAARGRLYLPREWLADEGVPLDPEGALADTRLPAVCKRGVSAARAHFARAYAAMERCDKQAMRPARLMAATYAAVLGRLERRGWTHLGERVSVPAWEKFFILARFSLGFDSVTNMTGDARGTTGRVHVVGGGLAGLAAALELAEAGRPVTVYEAGPACGGRCRSYFDRELGCRIDNGNHLLLSGNRAAMDFLARIGARDTLGGPKNPVFPFIDVRDGRRWTLRPNAGRIPWWVFVPSRGVPGARLRDYTSLVKLRSARPEATVGGVLPHNALYDRLIEPLAVSALNTAADLGSARLMWAVMAETLAQGGAQCVPCFPKDGLSESFIDPAVARIVALGGVIRTGHRVAALRIAEGRVVGLTGPQTVDVRADESVVLALPAPVAVGLLPGLTVPDEHESILNLHFRADVPPGEAGFVAVVGGIAEWVFVKSGVVSVTVSAANRLADRESGELAALIWSDVQAALGTAPEMPQWRLIREKRATFAATPAQHKRRPSATTWLKNLVLAGDWTNTGLPATIEGAIRSGFAAARQVGLPAPQR